MAKHSNSHRGTGRATRSGSLGSKGRHRKGFSVSSTLARARGLWG